MKQHCRALACIVIAHACVHQEACSDQAAHAMKGCEQGTVCASRHIMTFPSFNMPLYNMLLCQLAKSQMLLLPA